MAVGFSNTNKPINPRGLDASPKGYNRAALYSGKALDFDGVNDYVDLGQNLGFINTGDFTLLANAKFDVLSGDEPIMGQGSGSTGNAALVLVNALGKLRFAFYGDDLDWDEPIQTGKWYSLAFTFNRTTKARSIYVNGQLAVSDVTTLTPNATGNTFVIGKVPYLSTYADAQITGVKAFNTALTAAQVSDLYNNPEKIVPTGVSNDALKLWLPMMEGAGTTAYDGSGNGNHGTINGATYVNGVGAPVSQTAVIDWNKGSNLFAQSNDFSQSAWNLKNGTFTQGVADPIGGSQAWSWTATDTDPYIYQQFSVSGTHTMSIYAKGVGSTIGKNFEIRVATTTQSFVLTSEWQRFELDGSPSNTNLGFEYGNPAVVGDVVHIFGAQLEQGTTAGPYIPTFATAQTTPVLLPQGLTSGRDITGVNLFENVRKQGALNLDGNSWAEVHDNASLDITDAITLEAWVYFDGTNDKGFLGRWNTSANKRSYLLYNNGTKFRFYVSSDGTTNLNQQNNTAISTGWNHIVGVYDGAKIYTYLNGSVDGSQNYSSDIDANDSVIEIARYAGDIDKANTNQIAQPRIYNRALTAEEVARNYNASKGIYQ